MKNKKLIIAIIAVALVVAAAITFNSTYKPYENDPGDTEELYRENVANAGYANTIETAMPQTEIYNAVNEHFNSELPEGKTEKKAIIIGYDGCRADILAIRDEKNSAVSSLLADGGSIKLEYCGGVNYPEINTQDTSTAPGWCSILTGQWADVHGVTGNWIPKSMDAKTLMTSLAEEEKIDSAKFITTWTGHFSKDDSTYVPEVQYCKENNLPITFKRCIAYPHTHMTLMNEVKADDCSDLVFAIYEYTDSAGHGKGFSFNNPKYQKAFLKMDAYGYDVISAIKARETYDTEDWLIIVTSDHGGVETHHGKESIQERMTFVAMNKEFAIDNDTSPSDESSSLSKEQAIFTFHKAYTVASRWFDFFHYYDSPDNSRITEDGQDYYAIKHDSINNIAELKTYLCNYFSESLVDSVISEAYREKNGILYYKSVEIGDFIPVYYFDSTKAEFVSGTEDKATYNIIVTSRYDEEVLCEETDFEEETIKVKYIYENGKWVIDNYFKMSLYSPYEWNGK